MQKKELRTNGRPTIKSFKYKNDKTSKLVIQIPQMNSIDDAKITSQLMIQLDAIKEMIKAYEQKMKNYQIPLREKSSSQELISMEEIILMKDEQIKFINEEIKILKSVDQDEQEKDELKKKIEDINHIFKLAEELKIEKQQLVHLINDHSNQAEKFQKFKAGIIKLEAKYTDSCANRKEKLITYEEFKEKYEQEKKDQFINKRKKKQPSIRQRIDIFIDHISPPAENTNKDVKTYKKIQERKIKVESAVKNAKKKFYTEQAELNAKLEFLRDEDTLLDQKLKEKQIQKKTLEDKFNFNLKGRMKEMKHMLGVSSPKRNQMMYD